MVADRTTTRAERAMVCSVDHRATDIGLAVLADGGNAVDAAIAANAVLAVTCQHMCGLGGDLFALVHTGAGPPAVLNASGRAGAGASAAALRHEGLHRMPHRHRVESVTVPGCVDGWLALQQRYGRLPLSTLLGPAVDLATSGFEPSPLLVTASSLLADVSGADDFAEPAEGRLMRRPGLARTLQQIASSGRAGFYEGDFGAALLEVGRGQFSPADLARSQADWVEPLGLRVYEHEVWTVPPNSQGYLALAAARVAEMVGWPDDIESAAWPHVGIESVRAASFDRTVVLHEGADGEALIASNRLRPRAERITLDHAVDWGDQHEGGGTMYLCAADGEGMAVSLIQSNARDFGSLVVAGDTGVFLHNRGIGFSLAEGHRAELAPGRRPPHTLSPVLVTQPSGPVEAVLGTMGGDAQPQVVLQLLARLLVAGHEPGDVIGAPRWVLASRQPGSGFDTWSEQGRVRVWIEGDAPEEWRSGLERRGHVVDQFDHGAAYGHAHLIRRAEGGWVGASDPRAGGLAAGW